MIQTWGVLQQKYELCSEKENDNIAFLKIFYLKRIVTALSPLRGKTINNLINWS